MARLVGRVRLSRDSEASTSVDRQRETIENYARMHGHDIVGWAEDVDVSGSVSPLEAPELSRWLAVPGQWDVLCASAMDRLGRTLFGLNDLFRWAADNGKTVAAVRESIDLSTWTGRLVASVLAGVAEGELEAIRERTAGSHRKLRELGRWHGGPVPYGYRAEKTDDGYKLVPEPAEVDIVREVFEKVSERQSVNSITSDLRSRGVPTRRGKLWTNINVRRLVTGVWVLGQTTHNGRVVTDDQGLPLQVADPIVPRPLWDQANTVLKDNSRPRKRAHDTGLLLHVLHCHHCGEPMYLNIQQRRDRGVTYTYWRCSGKVKGANDCRAKAIRGDVIEPFVEQQLLDDIGDHEVTEPVFVPGSDNSDELDRVSRAIDTARREKDLGLYEGDEDSYYTRVAALVERRKALEANPGQPARWERRGTGETFREAWQRMDTDDRRQLLIDCGVIVHAAVDPFRMNYYVDIEAVRTRAPDFDPENTPDS